MVITATSLGRTGLQDWLIQRVTAMVLAVYSAYLVFYLILHPNLSYSAWHILFSTSGMRYASLLALVSLIAHAWIGFWTVSTDYLKPAFVRLPIQVAVILLLLGNLVWGIQILWGI